jgi:hypothetical protein
LTETAASDGRLFFRAAGCYARWRHFTIQPILFFGQSSPCGFHSLVAVVCRLIRRTFGKLGAIVRVLDKLLRLFHGVLLLQGTWEAGDRLQQVIGGTLSTLMNGCQLATADMNHE